MQIFINISITFALMFWPFLFAMSPMMLDSPGSENDKSHLIRMMLILSYPIGIFLLLWLFGGNYFSVRGFTLFTISTVVIAIAFLAFGYYSMLSNLTRGIANSGYSIADNRAYYDGKSIDGADSKSFTVLEEMESNFSASVYAKDRKHFYYAGAIVEGVISGNFQKTIINQDTYWVNSTQVIYMDRILPGANPDNFSGFEGFNRWTYSISNNKFMAYYSGKPLPDVDRKTFTPLNDFFAKDSNYIFEQEKIILSDAEADSFMILDDHDYGRDNNHIYYLSHLQPFAIKDIDPESFEILGGGFLRDKNHIYFTHQYKSIEKLEHVDITSFEVTHYDDSTNSNANDKNHYYYDEKIVGNKGGL